MRIVKFMLVLLITMTITATSVAEQKFYFKGAKGFKYWWEDTVCEICLLPIDMYVREITPDERNREIWGSLEGSKRERARIISYSKEFFVCGRCFEEYYPRFVNLLEDNFNRFMEVARGEKLLDRNKHDKEAKELEAMKIREKIIELKERVQILIEEEKERLQEE